ncbi:hypothetical protein J9S84_002803 [Salmonella enterica]|uniref:SinI family autotransporter-associated protein n=2 Tax=Salmonella enterica TaxID=28901 RepID=UPI0007168056|nr:SinI family autotransporter-associated protein [Salmonella enterica]EAA2613855.1 hypothetical protein [Salmonella enterica subsp. enterica serovar Virchow]EAC2034155.1 hypothetical protein [Salmonella enterica subsp. enterica]EBH8893650.1 hypothetical protein [Salmonella enterica subsp. enterica serovar Krefeld]EBW8618980.1 hypothetical protein [Salmonella enterica subsp. enterica serovar Enteritidis]EEG2350265.1 hypothetical protein [Salmonella enterica subsp. enterica serovar Kaneshie]EE
MQITVKRRLTKVALAVAVAGYCTIPSAIAANEGNLKNESIGGWQVSGSTGTIQGTVPRIKLPGAADSDVVGANVKVDIDRSGRKDGYTDTTDNGVNQLHIGDKLTVSWDINDTEGDYDTDNALTTKTVQWMCYTDQSKSGGKVLQGNGLTTNGDGSATYTIQASDADCYIGLKLTPMTKTGDPNIGALVDLADLSSGAGGGADDDAIPTGPVVDDSIEVAIYDSAAPTVNLLKDSSIKLQTGHTYVARLWKDADGNGKYDAGETEVTDQYDYKWVFTGTSLQLGTAGGDSNIQNSNLVIPVTNAEAKDLLFPSAGDDGVQGYGLSIKYKRK